MIVIIDDELKKAMEELHQTPLLQAIFEPHLA